jgi:hypothetical protein
MVNGLIVRHDASWFCSLRARRRKAILPRHARSSGAAEFGLCVQVNIPELHLGVP